MELLSILVVVGMVAGGILVIGTVILFLSGYIDWMNRGSH
jgi:hypothetical protein